jgi:septum formation protein
VKSHIAHRTSHLPLILASASPRRAELLRHAGIPFTVFVSPMHEPERKPAGLPTNLWPMCLAYMKATAVQRCAAHPKSKIDRGAPGRKSRIPPILAADTIVVSGTPPRERILNKPRDRAHARRMLQSLQGQTHRVITGICLLQGGKIRLASAQALCRIRKMSRPWLEDYLDSGLWRGKAGAYGIQDPAGGGRDPFVDLVAGDFSTVVGLPMALVQSELASFLED